jgi:hypothetical protein
MCTFHDITNWNKNWKKKTFELNNIWQNDAYPNDIRQTDQKQINLQPNEQNDIKQSDIRQSYFNVMTKKQYNFISMHRCLSHVELRSVLFE